MSLEKELEKELREDSKLEKVASLIESGVNVNHKLEATTFLNLAVIQNRLELVQILVEAGADVNSPKSPLAVAAHHGFQEIFEFLAPLTNPRERRRSTIDLPEGIRHRAKVEEWLNDFTQVGTKRHLQDTLASISARHHAQRLAKVLLVQALPLALCIDHPVVALDQQELSPQHGMHL